VHVAEVWKRSLRVISLDITFTLIIQVFIRIHSTFSLFNPPLSLIMGVHLAALLQIALIFVSQRISGIGKTTRS
jgi:hypothetical protein